VLAIAAALGVANADAQPAAKDIDAHLATAKAAAQFDFTVPWRASASRRRRGLAAMWSPGPAPDRVTWFTEPAKVFDNLYFVGTKISFVMGADQRRGDHPDRHAV